MHTAFYVGMKTDSTSDIHQHCEVADIFRLYGEVYRSKNGMTKKQYKVMTAIQGCRTSEYGYHVDSCDRCGFTESRFNSCRDRHCPKCQGVSRHKWVNSRIKDMLPVSYYHIVFTLPHFLNPITLYNKRLVYNLLLSSASDTLLSFGRDPKWLGGEIGFYGILHTWGQTLWPHPHIHFIVPGGALTPDGHWVEPRYKDQFLFPVKALSRVFRGRCIEGLKTAYYRGKLVLPQDLSELRRTDLFESWIDTLVSQDWVIYCKPPFSDAKHVIRYIGRYTHRVAISNHRIIDIHDGQVHFWYKDYRSDNITHQEMRLSGSEFIRRFLFHVLPDRFHKIRHYGFLANGRSKDMIARIRKILRIGQTGDGIPTDPFRPRCPKCNKGFLNPVTIMNRWGQNIAGWIRFVKIGYAFDTS